MSKSTCRSRLSSTATTPDLELNSIQLQNLFDFRSTDRRPNNINYVRQVLRRFFGGYNKKSTPISPTVSDDPLPEPFSTVRSVPDHLISPILIHPCLQYDKQTKFTGELLLEWFFIHFEGRYENLALTKQVISQCCTCLLALGVLQMETTPENEFFQTQNIYSWTSDYLKDDEETKIQSSSVTDDDLNQHLLESKEYKYQPSTSSTIWDILRSEYGFHSDVHRIDGKSISIQVDKAIQTDLSSTEVIIRDDYDLETFLFLQRCSTTNFDPMSSFLVSKSDLNSSSSSPRTRHVDENTVRQAMQKLFLHDHRNESAAPGDDDDDVCSSTQSFEHHHAKFTSELLLEWITLNSDSRNTNTQALIQQVKSCLHTNEKDLRRPLHLRASFNETKPLALSSLNLEQDVRALLSAMVTEVEKKLSIMSTPPPPPPPLPSFLLSNIPPPPLMMSAGIPPPPPPPMMPGFGAPLQLPQYLRKKHKYAVTEPVKKVQWSKINPYTIKKESMWVHVDEEKYVNDAFFSDIRKNFASKVALSRQPIHDLVDKSKELRVLDGKAAQNFAIMFSQLKVPPSVFREWMLSCDNENLKYDFLKQLEKYLPTSEELKILADFQIEINDLQYSEQYFCAIGDIKRLKQRLKTLLFKANYKETVEETEKAFLEVRSACDHVRHSIRFKKMLELILTIGNYMNSSAKSYEPIHGFDISFLPKLHSTKANDGRRSLLHFIVQAIEDKHRDLLSFSDEFYLVADGVSKINILEFQKQPQEINRELKNAREELLIAKETDEQIEGDRFAEEIEDFITLADDDVTRLEQLDEEMINAYQNLCDFLAIDQKNYSLTEFFTDLKLFCTFFSTCLQEIRVWREQAARAAKTTNMQLSVERKTRDIPDDEDLAHTSRRSSSRVEALIAKRKSNRGLTPPIASNKKRSQS